MTVEEDTRRMSLQTLEQYQVNYQAAVNREQPSTLRMMYAKTLELINEEIAKRKPLVPFLPSDEVPPF